MFPKERNNDAEKFIVNIEEFPWKDFDFSMYDILIVNYYPFHHVCFN